MIDAVDIVISTKLDQQMRESLQPAYPNEGCGIMIGNIVENKAILSRVVPAKNQNSERGHDRFEIDPLFYYKTEQSLTEGENVIGFYHSHPDCPEIASDTDRQFALHWPGFVWIIYRVDNGIAKSVRSWIIDDETNQFVEMNVEIK